MKNKAFSEILKKCFGKEKDERYHAIAMLAIYAIFILIVVLMIRLSGATGSSQEKKPTPTPTPTVTPAPTDNPTTEEDQKTDIVGNDVNYSYSYRITINGETEVYLGKKIDDKEKFTLIKNGVTTDYAILNDNYLKLENGIYNITQKPSEYFKYCDVEKILNLIENEQSDTNYLISNTKLSSVFNDKLKVDNNQNNEIKLTITDNVLKSIDFNLNNYITSVTSEAKTLTIHMEFADIGTTEDFEIKVS